MMTEKETVKETKKMKQRYRYRNLVQREENGDRQKERGEMEIQRKIERGGYGDTERERENKTEENRKKQRWGKKHRRKYRREN